MKGKKACYIPNPKCNSESDVGEVLKVKKLNGCTELKDYVLRPIPIDLRNYKCVKSTETDPSCKRHSKSDLNDSLVHSGSNSKNNSKNANMPQVMVSNSSVVFADRLYSNSGSIISKNTDDTSQKCSSYKSDVSPNKTLDRNLNNEIDNFNMDLDFPDGESLDCVNLNAVEYLKEDDYIYDNSIRIIKYISEGAQAKIYLGLIEEINKYVAIKRYTLPKYDKEVIEKITKENEILKNLENEYIVKYFDVDYTTESDTEVRKSKFKFIRFII
jgi:hypothetical protein